MEYFDICVKNPIQTTQYLCCDIKSKLISCFKDYCIKTDNMINVFFFFDKKSQECKNYLKYGMCFIININDKFQDADINISSEPINWILTDFIAHCKKHNIYWLYAKTKNPKDINVFYYGKYSLNYLHKNIKHTCKTKNIIINNIKIDKNGQIYYKNENDNSQIERIYYR
jgi:hypothetical protein